LAVGYKLGSKYFVRIGGDVVRAPICSEQNDLIRAVVG